MNYIKIFIYVCVITLKIEARVLGDSIFLESSVYNNMELNKNIFINPITGESVSLKNDYSHMLYLSGKSPIEQNLFLQAGIGFSRNLNTEFNIESKYTSIFLGTKYFPFKIVESLNIGLDLNYVLGHTIKISGIEPSYNYVIEKSVNLNCGYDFDISKSIILRTSYGYQFAVDGTNSPMQKINIGLGYGW